MELDCLSNAPNVDTFETRVSQGVDIRRNTNTNSPVGIYRCDIPTNDVHDATDISVRDTVYVGMYTASGGMLLMCPNYSPWCSYFETLSYGREY